MPPRAPEGAVARKLHCARSMHTWVRGLLVIFVSIFACEARANCARGPGYDVQIEANTVRICPWYPGDCGTRGMLRQNTATGEVVRLTDACLANNDCYFDECVAPGSYRYGPATPYECSSRGCGAAVPNWEPVTVSNELGTCAPTVDGGAATTFAGPAPWPNEQYRQCVGCGCSGTGTTVLVLQVALGAGALVWMLWRRKNA